MTRPFRFLSAANSSSAATHTHTQSPQPPSHVDSDFVVILAALLCALICILGLVAVARCAWLRRLSATRNNQRPPPAVANRGVRKKVLRSLPKETFSNDSPIAKLSDCAICLTEFAIGDEIRVLPQCGHVFHVYCIDMWLGSHSSCPSCRQLLVVGRCQKCGGLPPPPRSGGSGGGETESRVTQQQHDDANRFLP